MRIFRIPTHRPLRRTTIYPFRTNMKVAELKKTIGGYRTEQLRRLLVEISAYDSFQSVGVSQEDFFRAVLRHKRRHENPRDFVRNSIELALKHDLNRYTLYDDVL